ncbi:MAG: universal stress protein [Bacteroidota bacterium]
MKTILVATDFSPAAGNALLYAVKMARYLDAKVVLYHAYMSENYVPDLVLMPAAGNLQEENLTLMRNQVTSFEFLDPAKIEMICEPGIPAESILNAASQLNADWIVAGMKRTGLTFRKVFGSTALNLSRQSLIPLIIVPEDCIFQGVRSIALASDLTIENNLSMLNPLISFVEEFTARLYVVNVRRQSTDEIDAKAYTALNIKWSLEELMPKFKFLDDENVSESLNNYIDKNSIDMLALVAHDHSILERFFVKSTIKKMMFKGKVPLMILPDKKQAGIQQEPAYINKNLVS